MDIYVVQPGDTINSIADRHGISVEGLINDNGLINPNALVVGQSLIILYPQTTYTVKQGDTLHTIADSYGISIMQLIRNNPFLYDRDYIYPGESLVINFNRNKELQINGFTFAFINRDILNRTLPYLTYLSVFNYRVVEDGNLIVYGDDTDIIRMAKEYQTNPLLMLSAFSQTGDLEIDVIYNLLLNDEKQDKLTNEMLHIVRTKGFYGVNALISHINESNQNLYVKLLTKFSKALRNEGYFFVVTLNPNLKKVDEKLTFENIDYNNLSSIVDRIIFIKSMWGGMKEPPSPVSDTSLIRPFINYVTTIISPGIVSIGIPLIGYDWTLPFVPKSSDVNSMSLNSTITLAYDQRAVIQIDEVSQTPYYNYITSNVGAPESHMVWFIDARSIKALDDIIVDYNLVGSGIWNITTYYQQLWSMTNAYFVL